MSRRVVAESGRSYGVHPVLKATAQIDCVSSVTKYSASWATASIHRGDVVPARRGTTFDSGATSWRHWSSTSRMSGRASHQTLRTYMRILGPPNMATKPRLPRVRYALSPALAHAVRAAQLIARVVGPTR